MVETARVSSIILYGKVKGVMELKGTVSILLRCLQERRLGDENSSGNSLADLLRAAEEKRKDTNKRALARELNNENIGSQEVLA